MQRRRREEERREQAGRAAEAVAAQSVHEVHGGRPHGHREQPAQQEVRAGSTTNAFCERKLPWPSSHQTGATSTYSAPVR